MDQINTVKNVFLGGGAPIYVTDKSMFDEKYNYDFTNKSDDGKVYKRGKWNYKRPYGWNRVALNVKSSYPDSAWLGGTYFFQIS